MTKASKQIGKIPLKYLILMILTSLVIGFDQLTKSMVLAQFGLGATLPVLDHFFNLTYVQNRGAAFGFLAQANPSFRVPFFMIVPFIALVSIGLVFRKLPHDDRRHSSALSLVVGGAVGNLIDRVTLGFVVDFLDFHWNWVYHFPAFNVADSAICLGVAMLMLDMFIADKKQALQTEGVKFDASRAL